jgi:type VI secretion system protein ImpM
VIGIFGKLPAHGDFVRRQLPQTFVESWDSWLQEGILEARQALAEDFASVWAAAPAWRFRLPPHVCGDQAVAGVMLPSEDLVGRMFPLTLAALLPDATLAPPEDWYTALESAGRSGRDRGEHADVLAAAAAAAAPVESLSSGDLGPAPGWWTSAGARWDLCELPPASRFVMLLQGLA